MATRRGADAEEASGQAGSRRQGDAWAALKGVGQTGSRGKWVDMDQDKYEKESGPQQQQQQQQQQMQQQRLPTRLPVWPASPAMVHASESGQANTMGATQASSRGGDEEGA